MKNCATMPKRARASSPMALLGQLAHSSSRAKQLAALEHLEHLADSEDQATYEQVHVVATDVAHSLVALLEDNPSVLRNGAAGGVDSATSVVLR